MYISINKLIIFNKIGENTYGDIMNNKEYDLNSILGFAFGIISLASFNLLFAILGIVFSSIAKKEDNYTKMSKIGFTLSLITIIIYIVTLLIVALLVMFRLIPFIII